MASVKEVSKKAGNCYDAIMNNDLNISKLHSLAKSQVLPHGLNNVLLPSCPLHSDILGMILYGSQVRGDATEISDIDVLVVLDNARKINRTLYSELDCLEGLDPRVCIMLAHLPNEESKVGSLWLEVSQCCEVLMDTAKAIEKVITRSKKLVEDGKVVRKESHGQGYWVYA